MTDIEKAIVESVFYQQGIVNSVHSKIDELKKENFSSPSVVDLLTDIRDDIRFMRLQMETKKNYETKELKQPVRWKGQYENTGAMEVPATKND